MRQSVHNSHIDAKSKQLFTIWFDRLALMNHTGAFFHCHSSTNNRLSNSVNYHHSIKVNGPQQRSPFSCLNWVTQIYIAHNRNCKQNQISKQFVVRQFDAKVFMGILDCKYENSFVCNLNSVCKKNSQINNEDAAAVLKNGSSDELTVICIICQWTVVGVCEVWVWAYKRISIANSIRDKNASLSRLIEFQKHPILNETSIKRILA